MLKKRKHMKKSLTLPKLPQIGDVISGAGIEAGEVMQLRKEGEELLAVVREARKDGKIEFHEVILIIREGLDVAGLSIWQKVGRFFRRIFGRK